MTISVQTNKNTYTANGALKTFAYTFKIFTDSDLTVMTRTTGGVITSYTLDVDYTVTGAPGTGNVVFTTAPTDTDTVVILGEYDYLQSTDYEDGDSSPAATYENALDKSTMLLIKHKEQLGNTVQFPIEYDDGVVPMEAPVQFRHLMWDEDTLGSAVIVNDDFTGNVRFEVLLANGDIGSGVSQLQRGSVVDTISGTVDTNTANIATNASNIATASGVGATNTANIATVSGVAAKNTTDITTVSGLTVANKGWIADNSFDIIDNTVLIVTTSGILQAQINIINLNDAGNEALASGVENTTITLSPNQGDTNYYITANMKNTTDSPPTYYNYTTTATTTSGFTISFSAAIDSANYSIDWNLMR